MKKFTVFTLVMLMLVVTVVPAFAKGPQSGNHGIGAGNLGSGHNGFGVGIPYALSGTISSLDSDARTVTVTIVCGNRIVKPFMGQEVTLITTISTRFLQRNADGTVTPITFEDLAVGQNVSSHGTLTDNVWTATRVTSGALLNCLP